ncbi:CocE/NonD family hydrolase [Roseateles violae]|uniref:CocE/NonD family hydrolase n=1 Tax=Roseateles violae TaxID=3058042 RepID=A0ABT8E003_9BURK|nr:CocE/NonD family hydrolase [Pelomonas sp. PFR6]MDN3923191.1 CocE/NonD family hydrolase [Pelomonas sp. PFR6]
MTQASRAHGPAISSISLLERANGSSVLPPPEPMPAADLRLMLAMRDGTRLDTQVWLPQDRGQDARVAAILLRTPYKESVMGFKRLGVLRYVDAGYAVVIQTIRGIGISEGKFSFNAPHERCDGYDTVEWIASQPWCSGQVGMDGSSYVAMTQVAAALARPPHLRCIVPTVPTMDFFREVPYCGGVFARSHTLNWLRILQVESLNELKAGFMSTMPVLARPDVLERMLRRPARDAGADDLSGDFLEHYETVLRHPTFDDWFQERSFAAQELAGIDIPILLINGNFDASVGSLTLWRGIEAAEQHRPRHRLLIGPWDHGQSYAGGAESHGPYQFGTSAQLDLVDFRLAFFDQHLRARGSGPEMAERVRLFVTGANEWRDFASFPPAQARLREFHLSSGGRANSARGDGRLVAESVAEAQASDVFVDDPQLPFVGAIAAGLEPKLLLDMREREQHHETLVYDAGALDAPLTILGEARAELFVSADVPDADVIVWLVEHRADGRSIRLAQGQLRLRYHAGFDAERFIEPGATVRITVPLTYVAHRLPAGSRLRLLISGSNFPWADPNPHVAEPIGSAASCRKAVQQVHHDVQRPSRLLLPILEA